ncbi:ABC transporter permease [Rufibacter aurantiacus]|uniref:ABC transporter permease n=1 Tax=Rufibacter aurantiacus TaxID=2817374 RepID=UPI001B30A9D7|nr:ABC transporter permease [Rufibacter aurantiacus]
MLGQTVKGFLSGTNRMERLWLLAKIEFKLRYYENKLGLLWALLKPLMDVAIYYVVFKTILKSDLEAFASYLFIGLILWNFFLESTAGTTQILQTKKYLYEYSNMNKLEIYLSALMSNSIGFFFNLAMFIVFFNFVETDVMGLDVLNLWILPIFLNLFILSLALSLILSCIFVVAKDITQIWQVFTAGLFFLSPIFYKLTLFKQALPSFEYVNPIAGIIINARQVMMGKVLPDFELMLFDYGYALFLLLVGFILLNKIGAKAAEKL